MPLWNLNQIDDLSENVVESVPARGRTRRRQAFFGVAPKQGPLKVLVGVAAIAVSLTVGDALANWSTVRLPRVALVIARSVPNLSPPLESMFQNRFDSNWTEAEEHSLVSKIAERLLAKEDTARLDENISQFVFSNQQENLTLDTPLLSLNTIKQIVRKRKTT